MTLPATWGGSWVLSPFYSRQSRASTPTPQSLTTLPRLMQLSPGLLTPASGPKFCLLWNACANRSKDMGTRKDKVVALLENPCQCSDSQPGYPAAIIWDNFKAIDHEILPFTHSDFIEMGYTQAWELFKTSPCMYHSIALPYSRNYHDRVNQFYFSKTFFYKK